MQVDNIQKQYNLSRGAASRLLKVSIRTLDRYLTIKKLSSRVVSGRIWLNKEEIESFRMEKEQPITVDKVDMSTSKMSIDVDMDKVDNLDSDDQDTADILSTQPRKMGQGSGIYKKLYEEMKQELREKQERLEIANYRVGQLETQVRNSIPMLEYHRENYEKQKTEQDLRGKLEESTGLIKQFATKIKYEQFSKRAFLLVLLVILALQPLWLLLMRPL